MICRQCGREISPPAGACPFCQTSVDPIPNTPSLSQERRTIPNCPSCGEPTSADRLQCVICGFDRAIEPIMPCKACSRILAGSARFCWSCGAPVAAPELPVAAPAPQPPTPPQVPTPPKAPAPPKPPEPPQAADKVDRVDNPEAVRPPTPPAPPPAPPPVPAKPVPPAPPMPVAPAPPAPPPVGMKAPMPQASPGPPAAPPRPPAGPPPMAAASRPSPIAAPPANTVPPAPRPSKSHLLPILIGVGLVLILFVGGGAFAFWKFYWVPRSQQMESTLPSSPTQVAVQSGQQASETASQTSRPDEGVDTPSGADRPAETASSETSQETSATGLETRSGSGARTSDSPAGWNNSGRKRVPNDQQISSPVIAAQDDPVSSSSPSVPVDNEQSDRPESSSVADDSRVPSAEESREPVRPIEPPPGTDPVRPQPPRYEGPSRGTLTWTGDVVKGDQVIIENESANRGTVRGALPGVPCTISLSSQNVAVFEAPGPRNRYRRVGLRFNQNGRLTVVVTWEVIK